MRYVLTEKYFDGLRMHEAGAEIEFDGVPAHFMQPLNPDRGSIPQMHAELEAVNQQRQQVAGALRVAQLRLTRGEQTAADEVTGLKKKHQELGSLARELQASITHAEHDLKAQAEQRRRDVEDRIFGALDAGAVEVSKLCERIDKQISVLARDVARLQKAALDAHAIMGPITPIGTMLDFAMDPHLVARTIVGRLFKLSGINTAALSTLTPNGIDSVLNYGTLQETVTQYFDMLRSRRPQRDVEPLTDITEETANGEASP